MALTPAEEDPEAAAFELKGRMATLTVLRVLTSDVERLIRELGQRMEQAPRLLRGAPMVLDLDGVDGAEIDLQRLAEAMRELGAAPVAVRGQGAERQASAAGLGVLSAETERERSEQPAAGRQPAGRQEPAAQPEPRAARLLRNPVRSGQQVYARGGDLVVLGAVGPGAEVLADGDIHIYGALRGRALAGVQGNTQAGVYCLALEAELVSVAGHYQVNERLEPELLGGPAHVFLGEGGELRLESFGKS